MRFSPENTKSERPQDGYEQFHEPSLFRARKGYAAHEPTDSTKARYRSWLPGKSLELEKRYVSMTSARRISRSWQWIRLATVNQKDARRAQ